jgi:hypothetical protein
VTRAEAAAEVADCPRDRYAELEHRHKLLVDAEKVLVTAAQAYCNVVERPKLHGPAVRRALLQKLRTASDAVNAARAFYLDESLDSDEARERMATWRAERGW